MQNNSTQKVLHKKVNAIHPRDIHGDHCDFILQTSSNAQGKQRHSGGFKNSVKKIWQETDVICQSTFTGILNGRGYSGCRKSFNGICAL